MPRHNFEVRMKTGEFSDETIARAESIEELIVKLDAKRGQSTRRNDPDPFGIGLEGF